MLSANDEYKLMRFINHKTNTGLNDWRRALKNGDLVLLLSNVSRHVPALLNLDDGVVKADLENAQPGIILEVPTFFIPMNEGLSYSWYVLVEEKTYFVNGGFIFPHNALADEIPPEHDHTSHRLSVKI